MSAGINFKVSSQHVRNLKHKFTLADPFNEFFNENLTNWTSLQHPTPLSSYIISKIVK